MDDRTEALAQLAVVAGINVAAGQTVVVSASLGQEQLARAIAGACYDHGAHQVEVDYSDQHLRKVRLQRAPDEALGDVTPWVRQRMVEVEKVGGALIALSGPSAPGLLDDVDPDRIGRDTVSIPESMEVIARQQLTWTIIPGPTEAWAKLVFGEDQADPLDALWQRIVTICRLDADDPAAAWRQRSAELARSANRLSEAALDALHFQGPGTDLKVGLLPGMRWEGGGMTSVNGTDYLPNLPTEEVFTSPDPDRTEGTVTSTKPLLVSGRVIEGLKIRFEGGRAIQVDADAGAEVMRGLIGRDDGANRLGEVALVDASGRIGQTGIVYHDTLLDENAASHIAVGGGFPHLAGDESSESKVNVSGVHTDFMIGGPDVAVTGITRDGREIQVLVDGEWQLPSRP